jgi:hypothetical protein
MDGGEDRNNPQSLPNRIDLGKLYDCYNCIRQSPVQVAQLAFPKQLL